MKIKVLDNEIKTYQRIYDNMDNTLATQVLADIIIAFRKVDADGKINDTEFDNLVQNIKATLESVPSVDNFDLAQNINDDLDVYRKAKDECIYSIRALSWVKEEQTKKSK